MRIDVNATSGDKMKAMIEDLYKTPERRRQKPESGLGAPELGGQLLAHVFKWASLEAVGAAWRPERFF